MHEYNGLLIKQRGTKGLPFFVFSDTAARILEWTDVQRTFDVPHGAQRLFSKTHAKSLENFLLDKQCNALISPLIKASSLARDHFLNCFRENISLTFNKLRAIEPVRIHKKGLANVGSPRGERGLWAC